MRQGLPEAVRVADEKCVLLLKLFLCKRRRIFAGVLIYEPPRTLLVSFFQRGRATQQLKHEQHRKLQLVVA